MSSGRGDDDALKSWKETLRHAEGGLEALRRAIAEDGPGSPCVTGSRAMCWKMLLLFGSTDTTVWAERTRAVRDDYDKLRDQYLRYFTHPEELNKITADPLDDDPESPWKIYRDDMLLRAEIQQDVERLPDEGRYQDPVFQGRLVDALFVYCKLRPADGYRQGMHELFAPILDVLCGEAVVRREDDHDDHDTDENDHGLMADMMDAAHVVHDAFALFSRVMRRAHDFYAVGHARPHGAGHDPAKGESSAIVERSRHIHETCLAKADPELARHLTDVEVLPQIFLIRWVRLLFGREFPFGDVLALWDKMFAVDPDLELVDYICVAMLIRIRWSLLESDYSHCLQLLLKYPAPSPRHAPHTFVDDAMYLRDNLTAAGGASLILKYTGRQPASAAHEVHVSPGPSAPPARPEKKAASPTRRPLIARSPLPSPGAFIKQQGGMEAIFQGAARNVLERGERLGINRAVRDAVGEIRKNVQGLNEARQTARHVLLSSSGDGDGDGDEDAAARAAVEALERRNRLLAGMLDEAIVSLRAVAGSDALGDGAKTLELVEMVAARVQFVKVHLEDSTIAVTGEPADADLDEARDVTGQSGPEAPTVKTTTATTKTTPPSSPPTSPHPDETAPPLAPPEPEPPAQPVVPPPKPREQRPAAIPTRSTLAQSSFSWMLEPDESEAATAAAAAPLKAASPRSRGRAKRMSGNISRERNAFLFGEDAADAGGVEKVSAEDIFGMEPLARKDRGGAGARGLF